MKTGVEIRFGPGDRERLEAVVASGNSPQKHVSPQGRLRARRHDRHLLQGPGARDRLCQAPGRARAARERHAAGLPDGPRPGPQQAGWLGGREDLRADGRRDGEGGNRNDHVRLDPWRLPGRLDLEADRRAASGQGPSRVRADARRLRRAQRPGARRHHHREPCRGDREPPVLRGPEGRRAGRHQHRRHGDGARGRAGARARGARGVRRCAGAA